MNARIRTFVNLTVPQYLIFIFFTTGSAILVMAQSISPSIPENFLKVLISLSFAVFGLNSLNQIFDVEIDKISKPLRPIPAKEVSVKGVYIFSLSSFLMASLISLTVSRMFTKLTLFFVFLSIIYSVPPIRLKRYGISSNLIGGSLYGAIPFLSSWSIVGGDFNLNFFIFFYGLTIVIATMKDFEDSKADKKAGIDTLPVLLGPKKARYIMLFAVFSILFMMLVSSLLKKNIFIYPTLFSFIVLYYLTKIDFQNYADSTSQSRNVTLGMIAIVLVELSYGVTSFMIS